MIGHYQFDNKDDLRLGFEIFINVSILLIKYLKFRNILIDPSDKSGRCFFTDLFQA